MSHLQHLFVVNYLVSTNGKPLFWGTHHLSYIAAHMQFNGEVPPALSVGCSSHRVTLRHHFWSRSLLQMIQVSREDAKLPLWASVCAGLTGGLCGECSELSLPVGI